jgi:putative ABC transport system permease protein
MDLVNFCRMLSQDVRYRIRTLRKDPVFGAIIIVILGLGIGATVTMFGLVKAVMLDPLPFERADRLVRVWETSASRNVRQTAVSVPAFHDWQQQQTVFDQIAASEMATFNLTGGGDPERVAAARVTANLWPTLGVTPVLGRNFAREEEEQPGASHVVLIGNGLWQRRFGGDASLINQAIQLNGESYTVIGVLPPGIDFPGGREIWVPFVVDTAREPWRADRTNRNLAVFARMKAEVSVDAAQAEMNVIAKRLEEAYPASNGGWGVRLLTFSDWLVPEPLRRATMLLFGTVGLLLLLSCANVANLLLARAIARRREMATHAALGASRARLVRQLLIEGLLLSGLGALTGFLLALWGTRLIGAVTITELARQPHIQIDGQVLLFTLVVAAATGLAFGVVPAWSASRPDLAGILKTGGRLTGSTNRVSGVLVGVQIALTVTVLIGAMLFARSFVEIRRQPLGFTPENVLTFQINLPGSKYGEQASRVGFYTRLLDQVRAVPGVIEAGGTTHPPYAVSDWNVEIVLPHAASSAPADQRGLSAEARAVTPGYFRAVGVPVLRGRVFSEQDRLTPEPPLVVSQAFARRYWPGGDAVGQRMQAGRSNPVGTIIGVVADVRSSYQQEPQPAVYFPYGYIGMPSLTIAVHTNADAIGAVPAVRSMLRAIDPEQPIYNIRTVDQIVTTATAQPRFQAVVVGLLGLAALVLASFGTYSMIAYQVRQRRNEIALRIALGAGATDIVRILARQVMTYVLPGAAVGLIVAFAAAQVMRSLLVQVSATDTVTFVSVPLFLIGIALLACYLPARRVTLASPLPSLRHE